MSDIKLGQEFVDRVTRDDGDSPSVIGGHVSLMPDKAAWRRIYMDTMIKHAGLDEEQASDAFAAGESDYDYSEDPEQSALDEMSYWDDDGDGPLV